MAEVAAKQRWLARNWSLVWPGLGHLYAARTTAGVALAVARLLLIAVCVMVFRAPWGTLLLMVASLLVLTAFEIFAIVDAGRGLEAALAPLGESEPAPGIGAATESVARKPKDPWLAMFMSRMVPGLGHVYAGKWSIGLVLFAAILVAAGVSSQFVANLLAPLYSIGAGLLAFRVVTPGPEAFRRALRMGAAAILGSMVVLAIIGSIRGGLVQAFRNPSQSMAPTIQPGDLIFVDKTWGQPIRRGDIVAFDWPPDRTKRFVKRVVALPGETVEVRRKTVVVDGRSLDEPYARHVDPSVHSAADDARDEFGPLRLGEGQYFVLGDNRDNSNDSRFWGPVGHKDIRGRVLKRYWPLDRSGPIR